MSWVDWLATAVFFIGGVFVGRKQNYNGLVALVTVLAIWTVWRMA